MTVIRLSGRERAQRIVMVLLVVLLASCGRSQEERNNASPGPAKVEAVGIARSELRTTSQISDYAVYASNSVVLLERASVRGGDVGAASSTSGPFLTHGYPLALRERAAVDRSRDVLAERVLLSERATVGDVDANIVTNRGGSFSRKGPLPTLPSLPAVTTPAPGSVGFVVQEGRIRAMSPGAYGAVAVHGRLVLNGGTYDFASLALGERASVEALAPSRLQIAGRLSVAERASIGPRDPSLPASAVRIEVSGVNGASGALDANPKAATLGERARLRALLLAPNGTIELAERAEVVGAIVGRDLSVGEDATVTFEDGFTAGACGQSCSDSNPCTLDSCTAGVCTHTPVANGTACSDGSACTQTDTCQAGACVGSNPVLRAS